MILATNLIIKDMDIKNINIIVNSDLTDRVKEIQIIKLIAKDKNVIPLVMKILDSERASKQELISAMNLELSRAHIYIDMRQESKSESKEQINKGYIIDNISRFYIKYKDLITHCFNRFN